MNTTERKKALAVAAAAARAAGALMRRNLRLVKVINESHRHDLKIELDVRCQKLIAARLRAKFPGITLLGEEGIVGDPQAELRWVVDPIDGTVNFTYGIPHACVSIALQRRAPAGSPGLYPDGYQTLIGVVYDPFTDELWTARRGGAVQLNGRAIRVSQRARLADAIVAIGFSKTRAALTNMMPGFQKLAHRVLKIRIFGAAALSLAFVAGGRLDAYLELRLALWDIAAGCLLVEMAGGHCDMELVKAPYHYRMTASNGLIGRKIARFN